MGKNVVYGGREGGGTLSGPSMKDYGPKGNMALEFGTSLCACVNFLSPIFLATFYFGESAVAAALCYVTSEDVDLWKRTFRQSLLNSSNENFVLRTMLLLVTAILSFSYV